MRWRLPEHVEPFLGLLAGLIVLLVLMVVVGLCGVLLTTGLS